MDRTSIAKTFSARFGDEPALVVRAPGRVNLIGEHTDYNDGFVFPMAIDRHVWLALRPRRDRQVLVHSQDFDEPAQFDLGDLAQTKGHWGEYLKGVAWVLCQGDGELQGFEGVLASDVPVGAGLSSSAAVELAAARAFIALSGQSWDPTAMALVGQRAENEWLGVQCGVMDQMASARGRRGHALLLDCRSLALETIPLPQGTSVLVLDTSTRRRLTESGYNARRQECEDAAAHFGVPALRDVSVDVFDQGAQGLDEGPRRRARHVITENARTVAATRAMRDNEPAHLGQLMDQSHESLRDDFQVSTEALDAMVTCARREEGCFGARMTGAGFGGCAVALVEQDRARALARRITRSYVEATGIAPRVYVCQAQDGADLV
jgi:galactokinase